jgi:hypothetical protein
MPKTMKERYMIVGITTTHSQTRGPIALRTKMDISRHNNILQYINIENMGDREGIYFRLIHYIQYTFNI